MHMNTCSSIFGRRRRNYVKYGDSTLINYGDFHTHTVYSLHGMSSPSEMVDAAIEAGLTILLLLIIMLSMEKMIIIEVILLVERIK